MYEDAMWCSSTWLVTTCHKRKLKCQKAKRQPTRSCCTTSYDSDEHMVNARRTGLARSFGERRLVGFGGVVNVAFFLRQFTMTLTLVFDQSRHRGTWQKTSRTTLSASGIRRHTLLPVQGFWGRNRPHESSPSFATTIRHHGDYHNSDGARGGCRSIA